MKLVRSRRAGSECAAIFDSSITGAKDAGPARSGQLARLSRLLFLLVRSRYDSVPVSRMWALKVTRSTIAATRRGSGNSEPHSLNGGWCRCQWRRVPRVR
jgi:hypothetical protein